MAPKVNTGSSTVLIIPESTNYLTLPSETEENTHYKWFVKFLNTSYLQEALFNNPPLYVDVLEAFWKSATCTSIALEYGTSITAINYLTI